MGESDAGPVSPTLIGRADLLALARRRLDSAADGSGELLLFAGEAGIGKTRLLTDVVRLSRQADFAVALAGAAPGDAEIAAGLLTDLATELRHNSSTAANGDGILGRLAAPAGGDGAHQRRLLVGDLADRLEELAVRPTLVALEDLHWADDLTLDVLARLARRLRSLPLLVIGTYRSDELYPRVPMRAWRSRLLTQRFAEEVRLPRLNRADTAAMLSAIHGSALPAHLAGQVFERSDGIPLHVEEFLATIGDLPPTLADAVLIRADQLAPSARSLAGAAAVLGRSFDVDLLTAITGDRHDVVDASLRELTERFFVQPRGDQSTYDFRHALIRDALYADLPPHRRRDLHARTAEAAVAAGFADAFVSDHFERAHQPGKAHRYALSAARDAVAISAHREAVTLLERAVRTIPEPAESSTKASLVGSLAGELAAIDENAAAARAYQSAYELWLELDDRRSAAALVPPWVAVRHLLGAALDDRVAALRRGADLIADCSDADTDVVRASLFAELAAAYMLDRRLTEAIDYGERARALPIAATDRALQCHIDATLGSVLVFAGRMDEGWRLLEGSIARATEARLELQAARGYRMIGSSGSVLVEYERATRWLRAGVAYTERVERFNDRHYMAAHLGHVLWATGDWDAAVEMAEHALADGRGGITTRITALHVLGYVATGRGEPDRWLAEAAALGEEMAELQRVSPAWWGLAERAVLAGDPDAAIELCERGYEASARVRDAAYLFPYVVTGTRAHLDLRDATGARGWLARTGELIAERSIPGTLGALDHAQGLLLLYEGQTGKARARLEQAAATWSARRRFWEGAALLLDQARCARRSRRPADAARFVTAATEAYGSVGAPVPAFAPEQTADLVASQLSSRGTEVARLIATGATNREIAQALFIAPKTVAAHVEHILTKLGVSRRAQIASWVSSGE